MGGAWRRPRAGRLGRELGRGLHLPAREAEVEAGVLPLAPQRGLPLLVGEAPQGQGLPGLEVHRQGLGLKPGRLGLDPPLQDHHLLLKEGQGAVRPQVLEVGVGEEEVLEEGLLLGDVVLQGSGHEPLLLGEELHLPGPDEASFLVGDVGRLEAEAVLVVGEDPPGGGW